MTDSALQGRRFLLVLLALAAGLLALIIAPFAGGLFAATVFAAVLHPLHRRTTAAFGERPRLSAAVLTLTLALVVLVPLAGLTVAVVRQVMDGVDAAATILEEKGTEGLIQELPPGLRPIGRQIEALLPRGALPRGELPRAPDTPSRSESRSAATPAPAGADVPAMLGRAAVIAKAMLAGLSKLLIETGVLLVALYFLLAQGTALLRWIVATVPLPDHQVERFFDEFHDVTMAVFISTITTAALQAAVAALGYLFAGVPLFSLALLVTFIAALIPAIGGATIVVAVALLLLVTGSTGAGIFLVAWGLIPVALSDNIAKPLLAQRRLRLPGSVLFFAMLGGLVAFGPMGVVAGPLIVSFFLVVVRALRTEETEAPSPPSLAAAGT